MVKFCAFFTPTLIVANKDAAFLQQKPTCCHSVLLYRYDLSIDYYFLQTLLFSKGFTLVEFSLYKSLRNTSWRNVILRYILTLSIHPF